VHYVRLEQLGEGLAVCSSETVAAHWVDELVAEVSTSGSSGAALKSSGNPRCQYREVGIESRR
jgi:hypothetical protein